MTRFYIIQAFIDRNFWVHYNSSEKEQEPKTMN